MQRVYVHGTAVSSSWADSSASLTDLIFRCVRGALDDARMPVGDLEAVVLAAHDLVDGRSLTNMITAPAAAAFLKDETRLGDDGAAAFVLGDARIRSGSVRTCLVAAWGRASEGPVDDIAHALFDPFTTRPLGMTEIGVSGLRASRALIEHPEYAEHRAAAATRRGEVESAAGRIPAAAWPLRDAELPVWGDVVSAVVLSSEPGPVEVLGVGMSTEPFELGDRDLTGLPALRSAGEQALREARRSIDEIDVLEIDALTMFDEALALEAVGAAGSGRGMEALALDPRLDPAGARSVGYCAPAMGLIRIARAVQRVREGDGALALASGASVVAAQTQAVVVLGHAEHYDATHGRSCR
ncbi:hypothetical protein ACSDR0_46070 [Streptosporangium sp. G11]|uniref:hypothetical protein n=1 Tax=Streptosporangium sp. G11 TaxID=3436926 RepID=UPI003EBE9274